MSLQSKVSPSGSSYWRVVTAQISWDAREASFKLAGYKNEEARGTNAALEVRDVRVSGAEFDRFFGGVELEPFYRAARFKDEIFAEAESG